MACVAIKEEREFSAPTFLVFGALLRQHDIELDGVCRSRLAVRLHNSHVDVRRNAAADAIRVETGGEEEEERNHNDADAADKLLYDDGRSVHFFLEC